MEKFSEKQGTSKEERGSKEKGTDRGDKVSKRKSTNKSVKVSERHISDATGFSMATVSNALNYKKGLNIETAEKIRQTAREMGYYGVKAVSKIKFVMYKRLGTIVEDTPFFPQMLKGIERECRALGYELIVQDLDRRDDNFEAQIHFMQNDKTSAVILLGTELIDKDLDIVHGIDVPFVVIDYWNDDQSFDAVMATNSDSARSAVGYLIEKGHSEIGYLRGGFRINPFRDREAGYLLALQRSEIPFRKEFVITLTANMAGAYCDMLEYLSQKKKTDLPTAFFADNDVIALGAIKALKEKGYHVPDDISVIGFDDITFSSLFNPPLTTMRVPKLELGRTAVRRLNDIIRDHDNTHIKTQICTVFVERKSVRDLTLTGQ